MRGSPRPTTPTRPPRASRAGTDARRSGLGCLADRLRIEATERGVSRIDAGSGTAAPSARAREHAEQARREVREYLAGRRTFFSVPVDLAGLGPFQARVLDLALAVPYGRMASYSALAARLGRPGAARAVGNALAANPLPLIVPCHRIVRSDGTWGPYGLVGPALKTRLLALERGTPTLAGSSATRIVCRVGCEREQQVRPSSRVTFASADEALGAGYRACDLCEPARNER